MTAVDPGKELIDALKAIAVGRLDNGRALGGETARQLARTVLIECGIQWPKKKDTPASHEALKMSTSVV